MHDDDRPRVGLFTFGSPGDIFPFIAIAEALNRRGVVPFIASSSAYRGHVESRGIGFIGMRPERPEQLLDPDMSDRVLAGASPAKVFASMFLRDLRASYEDAVLVMQGLTAVVVHPLALGPALAAERLGIPRIAVQLQPMGMFSSREFPALGPPILAEALWGMPPALGAGVLAVVRAVASQWADSWHALRHEIGLPPAPNPLIGYMAESRLTLGLFSPLLGAAQSDWPEHAVVTGFPFATPRSSVLDPVVENFFAAGPPPVVFTLGTTAVMDPGPFHEVSATAAQLAGLRGVLLMGPHGPESPTLLGPDLLAIKWLDHAWAFPRASAVVHQGGIGTLAQAMRAGKPMIVMPYAHDQPDNARRMERLGIGRRIDRDDYRPPAVANALTSLLSDSSVLRKARDVGMVVRMEDGGTVAADCIKALIE